MKPAFPINLMYEMIDEATRKYKNISCCHKCKMFSNSFEVHEIKGKRTLYFMFNGPDHSTHAVKRELGQADGRAN
jgi:hypothetical protein